MKILILATLLLLLSTLLPTIYYQQTTTCLNETDCTTQSDWLTGPSLASRFLSQLKGL